ncbi:MAG: DUF6531 domain-containing protein [Pyrinomonadaceae bacterium]
MYRLLLTLSLLFSVTTLPSNQIIIASAAGGGATNSAGKSSGGAASCPTCMGGAGTQADAVSKSLDSVTALGRRTQASPLRPLPFSLFEGARINLVSTATGGLSFTVTDLGLPGSLPVSFERVYNSSRARDTGLGAGWSFIFDDRISVAGGAATLLAGDGSVTQFVGDGQGRFTLKTPAPGMHQSFALVGDGTAVEQVSILTRTYTKLGGEYRLSQIADANGNSIRIGFDARGNVASIAGPGGTISLTWSDGKSPQLLAAGDSAGRRVSFRQDAARLRAATDVAGAVWTYDYTAQGLSRAVDPLGRALLRVRYDRDGRVAEAGDAAGTSLYEYGAGAVSRRTVVTDPGGVKTVYEHSELGALTAMREEGGQVLIESDYDAANRPTRVSSPAVGETLMSYDAQNRPLRLTASDGNSTAYAYDAGGQVSSVTQGGVRTDFTRDARGNVVAAKSSDPARSFQATYDARGRLVAMASDSGNKLSREYDAAGNPTAFTSASGRFTTERDAAGLIVAESLPSGKTYSYAHDARGAVTKLSDSHGHTFTLERDASGALSKVVSSNGRWISATRDQYGRVMALSTSAGKSRRFGYDARGSLVDYTDAQGLHKHFGYDGRGRLRDVTADNGEKTVIARDGLGRVQNIASFDGKGTVYKYDKDGKLTGVERVGGDAARFLPAAYSPSPARAQWGGYGCMFGYDGFMMDPYEYDMFGWGYGYGYDMMDMGFMFEMGSCDAFGYFGYFGSGCNDPYYYYDPFDFFGYGLGCYSFGESHDDCVKRHRHACDLQFYACLSALVAGGVAFEASCTITTLIAGLPACTVITGIIAIFGGGACIINGVACNNNAEDGCP